MREEVNNIEELNELWSRLDKRYGDKGKHIELHIIENLPKYTENVSAR